MKEAFVRDMQRELGEQEAAELVEALNGEPITSIRLNDRKEGMPICTLGETVEWCRWGRYIDERPNFATDPLFHCGGYYVQEASSMYLWCMMERYVRKDALVIDCCAAPGGKSTLIAQYLTEGEGFVVSNEFVAKRANILAENMIKWGYPNMMVTNNAVSHFENVGAIFDCVVVDAPCSGEGMFRKDYNAREEWSEENVAMCVERQREILQSAAKLAKEGGVLIYSTCTFNRRENEENVEWMAREYDFEILEQRHFYPHRDKGEGLYMAVLKCKTIGKVGKIGKKSSLKKLKEQAEWLKDSEDYELVELKEQRCAVSLKWEETIERIAMCGANIFVVGVQYADLKGKEWVPSAGLALSQAVDESKFSIIDANYDTAMRYLRCEAITAGTGIKGIMMVRYEGHPLGWVKNVGNRCNNMYPAYWRVRC
ncbi:MAG: rRNA cytosine-C5-methyltransferase [Paludibacteraceae bacterium]|nr:rRNA cytosine-C5-methyltransferase [Paludibacteraceae bacterium]